jgi:hypothetical protein
MQNVAAVSGCSHASHLFAAPLCENQPQWKRIANVVFHVFTLAIPLLIYSFLRCSASSSTQTEENAPQNLTKAVQSPTQIDQLQKSVKNPSLTDLNLLQETVDSSASPNLSPLQEAALNKAYQLLKENPATTSFDFLSNYNSRVYGPLNPDISRMTQLYCNILEDFTLLMSAGIDSQKLLNIMDDLMNLAFAISYLTLKELPAYIEARAGGDGFERLSPKPSTSRIRTSADTINSQDSYVNCTIRRCHIVYSYLRGACQWSKEHKKLMLIPDVPKEHQDLFYQAGTLQNSWRELHNEFCQLFSDSLPLDEGCRLMFNQDLVDSPLNPLFAGAFPPDRWNISPIIDQKY